MCEEISIA